MPRSSAIARRDTREFDRGPSNHARLPFRFAVGGMALGRATRRSRPFGGRPGSAFAASRGAGAPRRMHPPPLEELRATRSTANHRKGRRHEPSSPSAPIQPNAKRPRPRAPRTLHRVRHLSRLGRRRAELPACRRARAARRLAGGAVAIVALRQSRVAVPRTRGGMAARKPSRPILESSSPPRGRS
jgi:hypothetical protein